MDRLTVNGLTFDDDRFIEIKSYNTYEKFIRMFNAEIERNLKYNNKYRGRNRRMVRKIYLTTAAKKEYRTIWQPKEIFDVPQWEAEK